MPGLQKDLILVNQSICAVEISMLMLMRRNGDKEAMKDKGIDMPCLLKKEICVALSLV